VHTGRRIFAFYRYVFGIARVEETTGSKTKTGISIGTPQYMSPEQLDAKPINFTTDIYSMGIMLFEILTGKPPFEGSLSSLITQHNSASIPSLSESIEDSRLAERIQSIVQKACAKDPSARFGSAGEMQEAVVEILQNIGQVPKNPLEFSDKTEKNTKESKFLQKENPVAKNENTV